MIRESLVASAVVALVLVGQVACSDGPRGSGEQRASVAPTTPELALAEDPGVPVADVYQFRSTEDPAVAEWPDVCTTNGYVTGNRRLGATLWTQRTRASDGLAMNDDARRVGTAVACAAITSVAVGAQAPFYARFTLPAGDFVGVGSCTVISNAVPAPGVILAGCSLRLVSTPDGSAGAVTSLSVLNASGDPRYSTGSNWTIRAYPPAGE